MEVVLLQLVKIFLSDGLGFSIGMMVAPRIKREVEKVFGPPEIAAECDQKRFSRDSLRNL